MNEKINSVLRILFAFGVVLLLCSTAFAELSCSTKKVTESNPKVFCNFNSTNYQIFNSSITPDNGLVVYLNENNFSVEPNRDYTFSINVDIRRSTAGNHFLLLKAGREQIEISIEVVKEVIEGDLNITYKIDYLDKYASIKLSILNNTGKNRKAIIRPELMPEGYKIDNIITDLEDDKLNTIEIKAYYKNPTTGTLALAIETTEDKHIIQIDLDKFNIPVTETESVFTPFFSLADGNTPLIAINIILFVAAIVLFTMFISRLGKVIVKKR
jgi:hypothetical protein